MCTALWLYVELYAELLNYSYVYNDYGSVCISWCVWIVHLDMCVFFSSISIRSFIRFQNSRSIDVKRSKHLCVRMLWESTEWLALGSSAPKYTRTYIQKYIRQQISTTKRKSIDLCACERNRKGKQHMEQKMTEPRITDLIIITIIVCSIESH